MADEAQAYDLAVIRKLLLAACTPAQLHRFCQDRAAFRPILNSFSPDHGLDERVARVMDYCQTHYLWDELLAEVERENPRQVARFAPHLYASVPRSPSGLRPLPKPRQYVYISDAKIDTLFPQIPAQFIDSFEPSPAKDSRPYKAAIVSAYVEEHLDVGTLDQPQAYFRGTITARILIDDDQVFIGCRRTDDRGGRQYVGLSGSLRHMAGTPSEELEKRAVRFNLTSSNAMFHTYLQQIPTHKLEPRAKHDDEPRLWPFVLHWGLVCGLPLLAAVASWWLIGYWALIPIVLALLWAVILPYLHFVLGPKAGAFIRELFEPHPSNIQDAVRRVVMGLYGPKQTYEFLAMTITEGERAGERVLLGSPLYVAVAGHGAP